MHCWDFSGHIMRGHHGRYLIMIIIDFFDDLLFSVIENIFEELQSEAMVSFWE